MSAKRHLLNVGDEIDIRFSSGRWRSGFKIIQILPAESQSNGGQDWMAQFTDGWAYYVRNIAHGLPRNLIKPAFNMPLSRVSNSSK